MCYDLNGAKGGLIEWHAGGLRPDASECYWGCVREVILADCE